MNDVYNSLLDGSVKEDSLMGVVPKESNNITIDKLVENLENNNLFSIISIDRENMENSVEFLNVKINYLENDYEVQIDILDMTEIRMKLIEGYNIFSGSYYTSQVEDAKHAKQVIITKMKFDNIPIEAYHLQIKILYVLSSDNYLAMDISSFKILENELLEMLSQTNTPPSPSLMYSTHYLSEKKIAWLHTHGLRRFGSVEFEFLNISDSIVEKCNNILSTIATNAIVDGPKKEEEEMIIAYSNNEELSFAWIRWEYAIEVLKTKGLFGKAKGFIGDINNRTGDEIEHAEPSGVILASADGSLKNPNVYKNYLGDNLMLYYSNFETLRMSMFAKENFYYFQNIFNIQKDSNNWSFLVKIACKYEEDENEKYEHMWFDVKDVGDEKITGILINTPYFVNNMKNGEVYENKTEDITDWIIYTPNMTLNPDNIYMYNKIYNSSNGGRS